VGKKLTAEQKRSRAAKRGWVTRRAKARIAKKLTTVKNVSQAKQVIAKIPEKRRTKKELEKIFTMRLNAMIEEYNAEELERLALEKKLTPEQKEILKLTEYWVDIQSEEMTSRFGWITLEPSRARHMKETQSWVDRMLIAEGQNRLDDEIALIAQESGLPLREIYTLWWSP